MPRFRGVVMATNFDEVVDPVETPAPEPQPDLFAHRLILTAAKPPPSRQANPFGMADRLAAAKPGATADEIEPPPVPLPMQPQRYR